MNWFNMRVFHFVKGFGFLSFEDEISVERVTQEHFINLNGKQVIINPTNLVLMIYCFIYLL